MVKAHPLFTVDGKPFLSLGGQAYNSTGYNPSDAEPAFMGVKLMHCNTLAIQVYWNQIEPEEGRFDFASVDTLLDLARRYQVKLTLLWFATWKNRVMDYAPDYVKLNPERYKRVIDPWSQALWVLSPHCQASFEADKRAFCALCEHLAEEDAAERTVLNIQLENEVGMRGSDRDYGLEGQADFEALVPAGLVSKMRAQGKGPAHEQWQAAGGKESGNWSEMFGRSGGEFMSTWRFATYIDGIAKAGKAIHNVPMYINAVPGELERRVLDIWKWCAPHLDYVGVDNPPADSRGYEAVISAYARDDNPLYIPEAHSFGPEVWMMFRAIGDYCSIGHHFTGPEHTLAEDGTLHPDAKLASDSFLIVSNAMPLLAKYRGTDRMHTVIQEHYQWSQTLQLDGYRGIVRFDGGHRGGGRKDWRHGMWGPPHHEFIAEREDGEHGRGFVFQVSRNEFYIVGAAFRLLLRAVLPPDRMRGVSGSGYHERYISIDEGHFDDDGSYVIDRRRNGDEIAFGIWAEADTGVVRALLCD